MQSQSQKERDTVVIIGTGGTIAGTAASAQDALGYTSAQLGVAELAAGLGVDRVETEQLAQIDSRDMSHALWQQLAHRVAEHLARPAVCGVVVTHGTDTMEETAYFLQRVLAPGKPVVLTGAMLPATHHQADGPRNLADAVTLARHPGALGVLVAFAGQVWSGLEVRKAHSHRLDAFNAGDAGPLALFEPTGLHDLRAWPLGVALGLPAISADLTTWPWVEVLASHAGFDARTVQALCEAGVRGLVVAGTGNGSLHHALRAALNNAVAAGVPVLLTSRCAAGGVLGDAPFEAAAALTPWQARVELLLRLLAVS